MQEEFAAVKLLAIHTNTSNFPAGTEKQIRNLDDLKGMKIRTIKGLTMEMWPLLGAAPVFVSGPDLYEAAEKGVVDGAEIDIGLLSAWKLYTQFKYWSDIGTSRNFFVLVMNLDKWNSLPPDLQEAVESVSGEFASKYFPATYWDAATKENVPKFRAEGFIQEVKTDPGQEEMWRELGGEPLWDAWVADMESEGLPGQQTLDNLLSILGK
jgi:TRAP-type C4-dicarboxylate transport system substrate-binding protein